MRPGAFHPDLGRTVDRARPGTEDAGPLLLLLFFYFMLCLRYLRSTRVGGTWGNCLSLAGCSVVERERKQAGPINPGNCRQVRYVSLPID